MPAPIQVEAIGEHHLYLVLSSAEKLKEHNIAILKSLISGGYQVVVITTNQPAAVLEKLYASRGIDLSRIFFIDAITRYAIGKASGITQNCRFINSPSNLTDLGIAITEVLNRRSAGKACLLFDSISTMLIYIPSINISKFIHFITSKLRLVDATGVFLAVEKGLDPLLLTQLTTYVDIVIDMDAPVSQPGSPGKEVPGPL
jgi:KaiC/GvpD/RAD55 family RecA-like ATPase